MAKSLRERGLKLLTSITKKPSVRDKAPDSTFLFSCPSCKKETGIDFSLVNITFTDVRENGREIILDKVNMSPDMRCARCNQVVARYVDGKWLKIGVV